MKKIEINTPLFMLTKGEFIELLKSVGIIQQEPTGETSHFVYGIKGIADLFGVSMPTAQTYKNTFLKPAVTQLGRKIVVDADLAMKLFQEQSNKK